MLGVALSNWLLALSKSMKLSNRSLAVNGKGRHPGWSARSSKLFVVRLTYPSLSICRRAASKRRLTLVCSRTRCALTRLPHAHYHPSCPSGVGGMDRVLRRAGSGLVLSRNDLLGFSFITTRHNAGSMSMRPW